MSKRLTKKLTEDRYGSNVNHGDLTAETCYYKLGKIEDIEDEVGVDIQTLFYVLKNGAWFKIDDHIVYYSVDGFDLKYIYFYMPVGNNKIRTNYTIKNYGKTWASSEEELLWTN